MFHSIDAVDAYILNNTLNKDNHFFLSNEIG